eukprot:TRINITY_DN49825_c0_g1_i1.p1 TRINITY_DN49825_c0_g1~~TRINITY_DN49825_c0_g1_i1.p1  ORF type:complete len:117 (-),score=26.65 TRINITY_DN49825_c0_g1_i1:444-794(-)
MCIRDRVIRYTPGQEYIKHWDGYHPLDELNQSPKLVDQGNRMVTALLYLSEVEEGGSTQFVNLRFQVEAVPGRLLVFHNCYPGTRCTHSDSNHAGTPVIAGEKWACNLWFRERPLD